MKRKIANSVWEYFLYLRNTHACKNCCKYCHICHIYCSDKRQYFAPFFKRMRKRFSFFYQCLWPRTENIECLIEDHGRMIRLLAHPLPSLSRQYKLSLFHSLPLCRRASLLTGEGGGGKVPNHTTAR